MGETPDQIASHIDATRALLHDNIQELEGRVRSAIDWRQHLKRHPRVFIAIALSAGLLMGHRVIRKTKHI